MEIEGEPLKWICITIYTRTKNKVFLNFYLVLNLTLLFTLVVAVAVTPAEAR